MKNRTPRSWWIFLLRVSLGAWFISSGIWKIAVSGLDRFLFDIGNYKMIAAPWDAVAAFTVPWVEVVTGVCLVFWVCQRAAILVLAGMVMTFIAAVSWAWAHQLNIACGCHGSDSLMNYTSKYLELFGYLVVLGLLYYHDVLAKRANNPANHPAYQG